MRHDRGARTRIARRLRAQSLRDLDRVTERRIRRVGVAGSLTDLADAADSGSAPAVRALLRLITNRTPSKARNKS